LWILNVNVHCSVIATHGSLATFVVVVLDKTHVVEVCIETMKLNIIAIIAPAARIAAVIALMFVEILERGDDAPSLIFHLVSRLYIFLALIAALALTTLAATTLLTTPFRLSECVKLFAVFSENTIAHVAWAAFDNVRDDHQIRGAE
jgi:hypothetical protein